jgi:hypothetical protein
MALFSIVAWPGGARAEAAGELSLRVTVRDGFPGIEPGMPLRVAVRIEHRGQDGVTIDLAPASGTWTECVQLTLAPIHASAGPSVQAQVVGQPVSPHAKLKRGGYAAGLWRFAADGTKSLRPGEYELRALLVVADGPGWKGTCAAEPIRLSVVAPTNAPEQVEARALAQAHDQIIDGRLEAAAATLDTLLQQQPASLRGWMLRGAVCERGGDAVAGIHCLNRAMQLHELMETEFPDPILETMSDRLLGRLLHGSPSGELPAWSRAPAALLAKADEAILKARPEGKLGASGTEEPPRRVESASAPATAAGWAGSARPVETPPVQRAAAEPTLPSGTIMPFDGLSEEAIRTESLGQWAETAKASSEYWHKDYSAAHATGEPDVPTHSDHTHSWSPSASERNLEWLDLTFFRPVYATAVRVRQSFNPGSIIRVEAFEANGASRVLWEGKDPNRYPKDQIAWLLVNFPRTEFPVRRIRLSLDTPAFKGWRQIDAVQLVGE